MISAEEEYMAASNACMEMNRLRMLTYDLETLGKDEYDKQGYGKQIANLLVIDNEATVSMSKNYKPTKKNRHIARRFHYVREGQRNKQHKINWISAEDQLADDMTKTQLSEKTKKQVDRTMIKLPGFLQ